MHHSREGPDSKRPCYNDRSLQITPSMQSNIESQVQTLRFHRLKNPASASNIYIEPLGYEKVLGVAKSHDDTSLDAPDRTSSRPLMTIAQEFLKGKKQVLLIMGDPGSGKSNFSHQLDSMLWREYTGPDKLISLLINLHDFPKTAPDLMGQVLTYKGFNQKQISDLKRRNLQFVLICDGYDEAQSTGNIYNSNRFNSPGQWRVKLIIACRSDKIGRDSDGRFQPEPDRYSFEKLDLFQKVAMAPFTYSQINEYVQKYVEQHQQHSQQHSDGHQSARLQPRLEAQVARKTQSSAEVSHVWDVQRYMETLIDVPNLMELVKNPYILSFVLGLLPEFVGSTHDISRSPISLDALYKCIFDDWMRVGKARLGSKGKTRAEQDAFIELLESGFSSTFMGTLKDLAVEIYTRQEGDPVVQYSHLRDMYKQQEQWKTKYFGPDPESRLFQESVPLIRSGHFFRFAHPSLLQYLYTLAVFDPDSSGEGGSGSDDPSGSEPSSGSFDSDNSERSAPGNLSRLSRGPVWPIQQTKEQQAQAQALERAQALEVALEQATALDKDHKLSVTNIAKRSMAIQFLADRVQDNPVFMKRLVETVRESRNNVDGADQTLAANAMTILVRSGMRFNSADLQGIKIRGANLTGGEFDSADLRNADLRNTILDKCCLRGARLEGAKLNAVQFGVLPYVDLSTILFVSPESPSESPATSSNSLGVIPTASAYTSDGNHYAVGFTNGFITIFDTLKWTIAHSFQGSKKSITAIAFSPNQGLLAFGDMFGEVRTRIVTGDTSTESVNFQAHADCISDLVFSSDGYRIATVSVDNKLGLWDVKSGSRIWNKSRRHVGASSVAFSPDGTQLASSGSDTLIRLWDVASGKCKGDLDGHSGPISKVLFSPSGHQIASASSDGTVRVWSVAKGSCEKTFFGHSDRVTGITYSPDGQRLVSCSEDSTIRTWDPRSGSKGPVYREHKDCVVSIVYSPDGKQFASCGRDKTLRVWECRTATKGAVIFGRTNTKSSGCYPYSTVKRHDNNNKNTTFQPAPQTPRVPTFQSTPFQGNGRVVTRSPDGSLTATLSSNSLSVQLWLRGANEPRVLTGHSKKITSLVFSPDSLHIASGSFDKTIQVWDTQSGDLIYSLEGHKRAVKSVAYSSNGNRIVSGSDDGTVRLWDSSRQQPSTVDAAVGEAPAGEAPAGEAPINPCLLTFGTEGESWSMQTVAISSCGNWVAAGGEDTKVRVWDTVNHTGMPHATFCGHGNTWNSIVFSPDSIHIASASEDSTVWVWNIQTREQKHILGHQGGSVKCLAYLPSGEFLASGGKNCRIWDVKTGYLEAELIHKRSVVSIASSWDGGKLWLGTEDLVVHDWLCADNGQDTALVSTTVFSGDCQLVASSLGGTSVHMWSTESGKRGPILEGHSGSIECISLSPVNNLLVTSSSDGTVGIWDSRTGKSLYMLKEHSGVVTGVAFSPNGDQFATVSMDHTFRLWNVVNQEDGFSIEGQYFPESSEERHVLPPGVDEAAPQGDIPQADDQGNLPPTGEQEEPQHASGQGPQAQMDQQESTIQEDETLEKQGQLLESSALFPYYHDPSGLEHIPVYSPDGREIAVTSMEHGVRRFDTRTGESLPSLINDKDKGMATCIAYIPSGGRIATSSGDNMARLWDPATGNVLKELRGHTDGVTSVVFSPFCHQVAASSTDGTVLLWNLLVDNADDFVGQPLIGHDGPVLCVAYSPDGKFLASGSADRTMRLWDAFTRAELAVVRDFAVGVKTIQWKRTRGRQLLLTGCKENLPQVWELVESIEDKTFELRRYWGAGVDALALSGACIGNDHGLTEGDCTLLKQRNATGLV